MNELIETKALDNKALTSLDYAKSLQITNDAICQEAIDYEHGLSALIKEIEATFGPHKDAAHKTWKGLVAEEKRHVDPVEEAKRLIKGKRITYDTEQTRIRKEAEAKLQAEARRLAEEAREVRDQHRGALETVRQERELLRVAGETARIAGEEARAAAEEARHAAMDAVRATADTLQANLEQMKVVEEMRRALRGLRDADKISSN